MNSELDCSHPEIEMISFDRTIKQPEFWFQQAWEMFEASCATYDSFARCGPLKCDKDRHQKNGLMKGAMLLLGLSVENALKGAYVYQDKPDLSNGKLDPGRFSETAHDLRDTAEKLNLNLSKYPSEYLDRLTMFVRWGSKYKAPLKQTEFNDWQDKQTMKVPHDFDIAKKLINSLQLASGFSEDKGWSAEK